MSADPAARGAANLVAPSIVKRPSVWSGRPYPVRRDAGAPDVAWFSIEGTPMTEEHWDADTSRSLQAFLDGNSFQVRDDRGEPIVHETFSIVSAPAPSRAGSSCPTPPGASTGSA